MASFLSNLAHLALRPQVIQGLFLGSRPQLQPRHSQAGTLQLASRGPAMQLPPALVNFRPQSPGQPLPEAVLQKMESVFGADFSDVRVYVGPEASSIGAQAFTHGPDLYFAHGQYNPTSPHGQRLIGHELTHVLQQRAGRVRNPFGSGVAVVQDPGLEAEAERMGLRASMLNTPPAPATFPSNIQNRALNKARSSSIQRTLQPSLGLSRRNTTSQVVQRMVAVAKRSTTTNFVENVSIHYAITRGGGPVGLMAQMDFSHVPGGVLYIVGHGSPGRSGDYSAQEIADFLTDPITGVGHDLRQVIFTSCHAGSGGAISSVVNTVRTALQAAGKHGVTVVGSTGPCVKSDFLGDLYTVWDNRIPSTTMGHSSRGAEIERPLTQQMKPQEKFNDWLAIHTTATIKERAAAAAAITSEFYQELVYQFEQARITKPSPIDLYIETTPKIPGPKRDYASEPTDADRRILIATGRQYDPVTHFRPRRDYSDSYIS